MNQTMKTFGGIIVSLILCMVFCSLVKLSKKQINQKMKTLGGIIVSLILCVVFCSSVHGLSSDTEILLKLLQKKGIVSEYEKTEPAQVAS